MQTSAHIISKKCIFASPGHSFTRQRLNTHVCGPASAERKEKSRKCLLPGLPAPPCASMQPRRECPALQHTGIADNLGGGKKGRECVWLCAHGREGAGWDEKTPPDVSRPMTAPPLLPPPRLL